jgi:hypothetical protein
MSYGVSIGSMKNVYVATQGSLPMNANSTRPMTMTAPVATIGDSHFARRDGSGRASSLILMARSRRPAKKRARIAHSRG